MKKKFVSIILSALFFLSININAQNLPEIRFGLIADIQYGDCENRGKRLYKKSLPKLDSCVFDLNKEKVDFTINLGDLIDRDPRDLDTIIAKLKQLNANVYNTTGNHDYYPEISNKELFKKLDMPAEYYSFKKGNWHFIIINTNEVASYANITGTPKEGELADFMSKIKLEGKNNGHSWNGGISEKQSVWLGKLLNKSQKKKENVLIFCHHPLYPQGSHVALNNSKIIETIAHHSCVKGVFSGHNHAGSFGNYNNIPFITTEGMVETETNAYCIVDIYSTGITVTGKGRSKSYKIELNPENTIATSPKNCKN